MQEENNTMYLLAMLLYVYLGNLVIFLLGAVATMGAIGAFFIAFDLVYDIWRKERK